MLTKKYRLLDGIVVVLARIILSTMDIFAAITQALLDRQTLKNKIYALLLIGCTLPVTLLEGDATATVFVGLIAVPMFFAKEQWIYSGR